MASSRIVAATHYTASLSADRGVAGGERRKCQARATLIVCHAESRAGVAPARPPQHLPERAGTAGRRIVGLHVRSHVWHSQSLRAHAEASSAGHRSDGLRRRVHSGVFERRVGEAYHHRSPRTARHDALERTRGRMHGGSGDSTERETPKTGFTQTPNWRTDDD